MKALFYIFLFFVLTGCASRKKLHVAESTSDAVSTVTGSATADSDLFIREREVRDSAIGFPERKVEDTARKLEDLEPTTDSRGKKHGRNYSKRENGLEAYLRIDADGNITYGCKADSFVIVVQNLVRERDSFARLSSKSWMQSQMESHRESTVVEKETVKRGLPWWIYLMAALAAAVMLFFMFFNRRL